MKILVAGLSQQSAAAVELLVGSMLQGAQVVVQPRGMLQPTLKPIALLQRCDLCVVDLLGLGYGAWSEEIEDELRDRVLGDRAAVLVAPSGAGGGWVGAFEQGRPRRGRVLLQHPLSTALMRQALSRLRTHALVAASANGHGLQPELQQPAGASLRKPPARAECDDGDASTEDPGFPSTNPPALPDEGGDLALASSTRRAHRHAAAAGAAAAAAEMAARAVTKAAKPPAKPRPRPQTQSEPAHRAAARAATPAATAEAAPTPAAPARHFGLNAASFAALGVACPQATRNPYLNRVCTMALESEPQELQIGAHSGCVIVPAENWAASNISNAMRARLTQHPLMLQIVDVRTLSAEATGPRAERLFGRRRDGRRPLDSFMWSLAYNTLSAEPPLAESDLLFQLERFPNFPRLPAAPDLFIQLALLCMRGPQSLQGLTRTFSGHDPRLVTLFVACAVLAGMARVLPPQEPAADKPSRSTPAKGPARPSTDAPGKAGFFRSLLSKLF